MNYLNLWEKVIDELKSKIKEKNVIINLKNCVIVQVKNNYIYIYHKEQLWINLFKNSYYLEIKETINNIFQTNLDIVFITKKKLPSDIKKDFSYEKFNISYIDKSFSFDNFAIDSNNSGAYTLCKQIASENSSFISPLIVYGSTGLGKTHLVKSIYIDTYKKNSVVYLSATDYLNYMQSLFLKKNQQLLNEFKQYLKSVDLLIVDDFQFLSNKKETLAFLLSVIDDLLNKKKNIVVTSDTELKKINGVSPHLVSRLSQGCSCVLREPTSQSLYKILHLWIKTNKFNFKNELNFSDDALKSISRCNIKNIRELNGIFKTILFNVINADYYIDKINRDLVEKIIKDNLNIEIKYKKISLKQNINYNYVKIIETVADYYHLNYQDLIGNKQYKKESLARSIAIYLIKKKLKLSYKEIGTLFSRNHSTIIRCFKKINDDFKQNKKNKNDLKNIIKILQNKN